ncbi:MAG: cation:proton antiporter [Desulfocapsaceae bacterium]|nr:cation:proton antiporter [Desulfocapsaceae bacterium]
MAKLTPNDFAIFLLAISTILIFARFGAEFGKKIGLPIVTAEIAVGVILGPTLLGNLVPDLYNYLFPFTSNARVSIALDGLFSLAVILLLFVAGLELQLGQVLRQGKIALSTGFGSMVLPFASGFAVSWLAPQWFGIDTSNRFQFSMFLGTAMSISALPVIARILLDLKIFRTKIGMVVIASAILNDLIGWLLFSFILSMSGPGKGLAGIGHTIIYISAFSVFMLVIGRMFLNRILPWVQSNLSWPGGVLSFSLGFCLLCAALTESMHVHAILGAFIAGVAIGDSVHLEEKAREIMHQFVTNFFAPLFFVSIGLKVDFVKNFDLLIVAIVLIVAFFGKVIGAYLGARLGGMKARSALSVGFGLNARGAVEILLGSLAFDAGLITQPIFVALVIMALVTSISSGPLMLYFLRGEEERD